MSGVYLFERASNRTNPCYFVSFALWQITSTARLKAKPKAIASHNEAFIINALIIIINEKRATITVKAFLSVKYFFIAVDLHEVFEVGKYKIHMRFFSFVFGGKDNFFD